MIPEIDNKFEKFDSVKYNSRSNLDSRVLRENKLDGCYLEMDKDNTYGWYGMTLKDSYYRITKIYYPNGNIKKKGLSANTGNFQKGVWYEFDEQGNLIKETDYDKPFTFTFEDILKFCEKHRIKINKGPILQSTGWHNDIFRDIQNGKPIWRIEHLKKTNLVEVIKIDGVTGKVLETSSYGYINN
ncbi:hypothetical protein IW16_21070 [Chryseobacterium vrystaatense]|uniref:MORN repeat variant n=2 Tax=Chryseobacterium vrystaatense TaxID=307480 RepID=A0ABR4UI85_9FLAO|nr:hypothetical protein IW16_21070 [Chryseobacterium vrystaatense]